MFLLQSVETDAYDHHSAIYYLLNERLRQHRTSYPEQNNVSTRIRRGSYMADQVIVKNKSVQGIVGHKPQIVPTPVSRANATLQHALHERHLGEVKIPPDIGKSSVPGCIREFVPSPFSRRAPHITPTQSIGTVSEEGSVEENNNFDTTPPKARNNRRGRRSAVDAMMQMNSRRHTVQGTPSTNETLFVPANHPLLKQDTSDRPPESSNAFMNNVKIQIVEPTIPVTEPTSASMMTILPQQNMTVPLSPFAHKIDLGFNEGRRASDGVNAPFRHLLHNSEKYLKEYQELQDLLKRSATPEQIDAHQKSHNFFIENSLGQDVNISNEWKSSPMSSQNELMLTLQSMHLASNDYEMNDIEQTWTAPGPCRRPASYRKISGGVSPIPAHIRKRRAPVIGESNFSSFDSMDDSS